MQTSKLPTFKKTRGILPAQGFTVKAFESKPVKAPSKLVVPPSKGTHDYDVTSQFFGLPPSTSQSINPLTDDQQLTGLNTQIRNLGQDYAGKLPNPFAQIEYENSKDKATSLAELAALKELSPPQSTFQDFIPKTPSKRELVPIPERGTPQVNPWAAGLGALGAMIAPEGAAQFATNTAQGAINQSDTEYADKLRNRQLLVQYYDKMHEDEVQNTEQLNKFAESNLRGHELTKFRNALGNYDFEKLKAQLLSKVKGAEAGADAVKGLTDQQREAQKVLMRLDAAREERNLLLQRIQGKNAYELEELKLKSAEERTKGTVAGALQRTQLHEQGANTRNTAKIASQETIAANRVKAQREIAAANRNAAMARVNARINATGGKSKQGMDPAEWDRRMMAGVMKKNADDADKAFDKWDQRYNETENESDPAKARRNLGLKPDRRTDPVWLKLKRQSEEADSAFQGILTQKKAPPAPNAPKASDPLGIR